MQRREIEKNLCFSGRIISVGYTVWHLVKDFYTLCSMSSPNAFTWNLSLNPRWRPFKWPEMSAVSSSLNPSLGRERRSISPGAWVEGRRDGWHSRLPFKLKEGLSNEAHKNTRRFPFFLFLVRAFQNTFWCKDRCPLNACYTHVWFIHTIRDSQVIFFYSSITNYGKFNIRHQRF